MPPTQDRIGSVYDGTRISPGLEEHSDAPLKHWQEHMKRKRERQQEQRRKEQEKNTPSTPPGTIDEYV